MKYDPGEWRNSANRPSKSGVLGLIAAALGIEREEQARFDALRDSLGFAVRVDDPGQPAYDYHTSQVPPQKRNRRFATRADELAVPKTELKTILSTREFRVNARNARALAQAGGWATGRHARRHRQCPAETALHTLRGAEVASADVALRVGNLGGGKCARRLRRV